jgi:hypothetical protein
MVDFKVLQEGYDLALRQGRKDLADGFRRKIDALRESELERVAPRDLAQFELSKVEESLYVDPPEGFKTAIGRLEVLQSQSPAVLKVPSFWVLRAAALGQKYAYEKRQDTTEQVLQEIVDQALVAIKQAVDQGQKGWLQYLADGRGPDDDLVELAKLSAVREALGLR